MYSEAKQGSTGWEQGPSKLSILHSMHLSKETKAILEAGNPHTIHICSSHTMCTPLKGRHQFSFEQCPIFWHFSPK